MFAKPILPLFGACQRGTRLGNLAPQHVAYPCERLVVGEVNRLFGRVRLQRMAQILLDVAGAAFEFGQPRTKRVDHRMVQVQNTLSFRLDQCGVSADIQR